MRPTLSILLPILTLTTAQPPKCGTLHPTLTLSPIALSSYFTYTTPSASGPKAGYISFALTNNEVDYATQCSGVTSLPLGQFYSTSIFDCTSPEQSANQKSSFAFDSNTQVVSLNTTWTCGGNVAYGINVYGRADLQCKTEKWVNQNWKRGELYSNTSTVCQPASLVIAT